MDSRISSEISYEYAGFWVRLLAWIIDIFILTILEYLLVFLLVYQDISFIGILIIEEFIGLRILLFNFAFQFIYFTGFIYTKGATPGKSALGMKVVDEHTGRTVSLSSAIIRYFGYILSAIPLDLGFLWIAFSPNKRGWHDLMAGTVVIRKIENPSFSAESSNKVLVFSDESIPQFKIYLSYPRLSEVGEMELPCDEQITIGRDFDMSQIVMEDFDNSVSRAHAKLKVLEEGRRVVLEDCGSSNGTYLTSGKALIPGVPITLNQGQGFYLSKPEFSFVVKRLPRQ